MRWTIGLLLAVLAFSGAGCAQSGDLAMVAPPPPPPSPVGEEEMARAERLSREQLAAAHREEAGAERRAALEAAARERDRRAARMADTPPPRPREGEVPPVARPAVPGRAAASPADPATRPDTAVATVDEVLSQLSLGHVAFNAPQRIQVDETVSIKAALSPDRGEAAVLERIDEPGARVSEALQVSNLMEARLSGEGFDIRPVTRERQAVGTGVTEWIWDVTPTAGGRRQLTLTIDALITVNGELAPKTLRTFRKPIDVEVTLARRVGDFAGEHGKWVWTTLLVPLFGWVVKKRRDRTAKQDGGTTG